MTSRRSSSSSSSSSSSRSEATSGHARGSSVTSRDTVQAVSQQRARSPTNTIDGTSLGETTTIRSNSPTVSHKSAGVTRTTYDGVSVATTANTGATSGSQTQRVPSGIPVIRPPDLQTPPNSRISTNVPQGPVGYPVQPPNQGPIRIDVASAHQQFQQRTAEPPISSYSKNPTNALVSICLVQ